VGTRIGKIGADGEIHCVGRSTGVGMRRILVSASAVAMALLLVTGPQARAESNVGVVEGTVESGHWPGTSFTLALTLVGTVSVGGVAYVGSFTVSGPTGGYNYHFAPPYPITESLALSGTTPLGNTISGTCGQPGSTMAWGGSGVPFVPYFDVVLVCSAAIDGGARGPLTVTVSTVPEWGAQALLQPVLSLSALQSLPQPFDSGRVHGFFR
jgi:hypothetical protein